MESENFRVEPERTEDPPVEAEEPVEAAQPETEPAPETEDAPEAPAEEEDAEGPTGETVAEAIPGVEAPKSSGIKKLIRKWWFWVIAAAVVCGLVIGIVSLTGSSNRGGGSGGSSSTYIPHTYVSPYVTLIKEARNSTYGITYGKAFDSFFSNPKWEYFQATTGEDVVEFTGGFLYSGSPATAKIQFVLDLKGGSFTASYLSINGQAQNWLMRVIMIQKVFESY